jgi:hypothetical protein
MVMNGGASKYPLPVGVIKFPNQTTKEYTPTNGIWDASMFKHAEELDSWAKFSQHQIKEYYDNDPVLDFTKSWERPVTPTLAPENLVLQRMYSFCAAWSSSDRGLMSGRRERVLRVRCRPANCCRVPFQPL